MKQLLTAAIILLLASCTSEYDIIIAGASASGTAAAIQSSRMGAKVLVIEESPWVGGMLTAAGVSAVDGNYNLRGGIFGEFTDSLAARYGGYPALQTGWVSNILFEPKTGEAVFSNMLDGSGAVTLRNAAIKSVRQKGKHWSVSYTVNENAAPKRAKAKVLIDCTELGDLAASLGVAYSIGMDARADCGEDIAPEQANDIIQDLTYVIIAQDYGTDASIPCPEGYDRSLYTSCTDTWNPYMMLSYGRLPGGKIMLNWPLSGNDCYANMIDATPSQRDSIVRKVKNISLGYLYYIQNELGYKNLGIAKDEFPTPDGLALIPYHRESRRIDGLVRFSLNDVTDPYRNSLYRSDIAVGDYAVDHHHKRYNGEQELPDLHFYPVPSFSVPLGVMFPTGNDNLLVAEKSISVTNIMNGATRLQPVVMELGQAAGAVAAIASRKGISTREVSVREVQDTLLESGAYLLPYLDLPKDDPHFKALQRIGLTGIMHAQGRNSGWTNQTFFRAEETLFADELYLEGFVHGYARPTGHDAVTVEGLSGILGTSISESMFADCGLGGFAPGKELSRLEAAVLIDRILDPFHRHDVDLRGELR